jgi:hypothetical protein
MRVIVSRLAIGFASRQSEPAHSPSQGRPPAAGYRITTVDSTNQSDVITITRGRAHGTLTTSGRAAVFGSTPGFLVVRRPVALIVVTSTSTRDSPRVATCTGITFCEQ